jgi:glycosyltransferase involved in cell wall biosynthesis
LSRVGYQMVFVDDSTDQTPEVIHSLRKSDDRIVLLHREGVEQEGGLSTAVTMGMDAAANASKYTCVIAYVSTSGQYLRPRLLPGEED